MHAGNYRTGAEEQQRLEEGVRDDVKDCSDKRADAARQEHVTELRDGRISQNFLDVVLRETDGGGKESSRRTDDSDDEHRGRCVRKDCRTADDHVDAGSHHRRGVNQCRDGSWTSHRVRQPNVQRYLRALSGGADKQQHCDRCRATREYRARREWFDRRCLEERQGRVRHFTCGRVREETDGAGDEERQHDAEYKTPVADAVGDERFFRSVAGFLAIEVVTNQQVRTKTHAFPTDKHQHEVVGEHESQHRKHEQIEERKEAIETLFSAHVTNGKDVNEKPNKRDEQRVRAAQAVHREREVSAKSSDLQPRPNVIEYGRLRTQCAASFEREIERNQRRDCYRSTRDNADKAFIAHTPACEPIDRGAREGRKDDQTEEIIFHQSFKMLASSTSSDSRFRKIAMMIPSPTAASAAATVITMTLRLMITPVTPIVNRMAESARYHESCGSIVLISLCISWIDAEQLRCFFTRICFH